MKENLNFWQMEDNLNMLANRRRPQYLSKLKMEYDLNIWQIEDDCNILAIYYCFSRLKDDIHFLLALAGLASLSLCLY